MIAPGAVAAVVRYSLLELTRRRFVLVFLVLGLAVAGFLEWIPSVLLNQPVRGEDRSAAILLVLGGVGAPSRSPFLAISPATVIGLCAYAIGMVIINHDLDSGAVVSILAKPVSRAGYAFGKALAGVTLLFGVAIFIALCVSALMGLNGQNYAGVVVTYFLATAGNLVVLMLLVMILTVYLNNVVAAVIAFVASQIVSVVAPLHTAVLGGDIADAFWIRAIDIAYGVEPLRLTSALAREAAAQAFRLGISRPEGGPDALVPATSGAADLVIWALYVFALFGLLVLALRRKQI